MSVNDDKGYFAKGYFPNWSEEVLVIEKVKNTVLWPYFFMLLTNKKLLEHSAKKELQETNQKEFRIEKVIKRKGNKLR